KVALSSGIVMGISTCYNTVGIRPAFSKTTPKHLCHMWPVGSGQGAGARRFHRDCLPDKLWPGPRHGGDAESSAAVQQRMPAAIPLHRHRRRGSSQAAYGGGVSDGPQFSRGTVESAFGA